MHPVVGLQGKVGCSSGRERITSEPKQPNTRSVPCLLILVSGSSPWPNSSSPLHFSHLILMYFSYFISHYTYYKCSKSFGKWGGWQRRSSGFIIHLNHYSKCNSSASLLPLPPPPIFCMRTFPLLFFFLSRQSLIL